MSFNEIMSTRFLFQDLRYFAQPELCEPFQLNCSTSNKGRRNVLYFCSFIFTTLSVYFVPWNLEKTYAIRWAPELFCMWHKSLCQPPLLRFMGACCDSTSISLDSRSDPAVPCAVKIQMSLVIYRLQICPTPHEPWNYLGSANCRWVSISMNSLSDFSNQTCIYFLELLSQGDFKWWFLIVLE